MRVWVHLDNAPHAWFFWPVVEELRARGAEVLITARPLGRAPEMAEKLGLNPEILGKHSAGLAGKALALAESVAQMLRWARGKGLDLALSHNSYSQILAANLLGLKAATFMDYEGQPANHLAFRLADLVAVPEAFPSEALRRFGAKRVFKYPGFKEEVYLARWAPGADPWPRHPVALVRPPAPYALYRPKDRGLIPKILEFLRDKGYEAVILERGQLLGPGPDLLFHADAFFGAGGTMTREAALLGTPSHTIFPKPLPAVDKKLVEMGLLVDLRDGDLSKIRLERRPRPRLNQNLAKLLVEKLVSLLGTKP